ncbi:hypothetical protein HZB88_01280 [archaeon]|nr:hypothetical protein [archaeon]
MIIEAILGFAAAVVILGLYLQFMPDSFGAAAVIVLLVYAEFLAYLYFKMKKQRNVHAKRSAEIKEAEIVRETLKQGDEKENGEDAKYKQLKDYINYNLKYGKKSKDEIFNELVKRGWKREKIEEVFEGIV